jgi:hypothetical protein
MVHRLRVPIASPIALVGTALALAMAAESPAQASESDYLAAVQPRFSFLSAQQLLAEGHKVCQAVGHNGNGMIAPDAVNMVVKDLSVSVAVADDIVAAAIVDLPC